MNNLDLHLNFNDLKHYMDLLIYISIIFLKFRKN